MNVFGNNYYTDNCYKNEQAFECYSICSCPSLYQNLSTNMTSHSTLNEHTDLVIIQRQMKWSRSHALSTMQAIISLAYVAEKTHVNCLLTE